MYAQRNTVMVFPIKPPIVPETGKNTLDRQTMAHLELIAESAKSFSEQADVLKHALERLVAAHDMAQRAFDGKMADSLP